VIKLVVFQNRITISTFNLVVAIKIYRKWKKISVKIIFWLHLTSYIFWSSYSNLEGNMLLMY